MINEHLREARINRMTAFLRDVEILYNAMTAGKKAKSRIDKLRNYSLSLLAAKSDDMLRPVAELCEQLLDTITDGQPFEAEKNAKAEAVMADIRTEVHRLWHSI